MVKFIAESGPGENDKLASVVYTSGGGTVDGQALNDTGNTHTAGNQLVKSSSTLPGQVGIGGATASGYALKVAVTHFIFISIRRA